MAKLVKYIFIPIFYVFVMSHNVSAASLNYNLNDYSWKSSVNLGTQYCAYAYDTFGTSPSICILDRSRPNMYGLISYSIAHKKDDVAEFYLGFQSNISGANTSNNLGLFIDNFGTIDDNYKIIGFENVSSNVRVHFPENSSSIYCDATDAHFLECSQATTAVDPNYYAEVYKFTILYTTTGSHPVGVRSLNANTPIARCVIENAIINSGAQCQVRIFGYTQWEYKGSSVNKEQADATQESADASETAGGSSASSSQQGTASLISAIGSAVSVITSASPTNCKLNGNMGNLNVGQIDLCANPVPTFVQIIGSIILILMVVPLCITLFNRFIGLFRSFQS